MTRDTRVLVTGFGPFPGVPHNVSSEIAEACAQAWTMKAGVSAESLILATDWKTAPTRARTYVERSQPDIIIHLGVSDDATNLTLETHAYNECDAKADASGNTPEKTVLRPGHPSVRKTSAPVEKITDALRNNDRKITVSDNPGRYLCNAVYHETLCLNHKQGRQRACIFIHIPTQLTENTVTRASLLQELTIILEAMLPH